MRASPWRIWDQLTDRQREVATRRATAIRTVEDLVAAGVRRPDAVAEVAGQTGHSRSTLYRWRRRVNGHDCSEWAPLLAPRHAGCIVTHEIPVEAWDILRSDYLRAEAPALSACYERLQRIAAERGWQLPAQRTLLRRLRREIPRPVRVLARQGPEALKRCYPPQERDRSGLHALEAVNADGHKFDVMVRWPDGSVGRPVMLGWQDLRSSKVLAWRVDRTENADLVRLAFGDMIDRWGIPYRAYLDNGRGFASKWLTGGTPNRYRFRVRAEDPVGVLVACGVEPKWVLPYSGQSKPIERAFRDLCEYIARHPSFSGAYTGSDPTQKPHNYGSRAVELDEFLAVVETEIAAHNARTGRRAKVCAGRSFDEVFAESYATAPIRRATAEQRRVWLLAADGVRAHRADGSIHLAGNRYWHEELAPVAGERVVVRFDPAALHGAVWVYTTAGQLIAEAACIQAAGFEDMEAARAHAAARKRFTRRQRELLDAERRLAASEVGAAVPAGEDDAPPPASGVVRPIFGRGKDTRQAADHEADDQGDRESEREADMARVIHEMWEREKKDVFPW